MRTHVAQKKGRYALASLLLAIGLVSGGHAASR
jgi:hypothetical protein